MSRRQTGRMVLRVWTEAGSTEPLRVDVRQTYGLSRGFRRTLTLTDVDLVVGAVRKFLEAGRAVGAVGGNGDGGPVGRAGHVTVTPGSRGCDTITTEPAAVSGTPSGPQPSRQPRTENPRSPLWAL